MKLKQFTEADRDNYLEVRDDDRHTALITEPVCSRGGYGESDETRIAVVDLYGITVYSIDRHGNEEFVLYEMSYDMAKKVVEFLEPIDLFNFGGF